MTTPLETITGTRKFGKNKGNSRLWIEGKLLEPQGWTKGKRYSRTVVDNCIMLVADPEGKLKVAGSEGRPVLDISGKWMTEWQGDATEAVISVSQKDIIIIKGT